MLALIERHFGSSFEVFADRVRAVQLRMRGSHLGYGTRVGKRCVFRRPWCLVTGEGTQFEHEVYIKATEDKAGINLGREVFVGFGCEFDISERLSIGDHVLIAPGCFITDHNHRHAARQRIAEQGCQSAAVQVHEDAWLGAHAVILPGVTIGRGAIVAAGAVVTRDVAPMTIVAGVPACLIGNRV